MNYLLGLDNGGTKVKAVLFTENGSIVDCSSESADIEFSDNIFAIRDVETLYFKNCRCIKNLLRSSSVDPCEIKAVSFSGHGKGLYLWGKKGSIYPGISSLDNRAIEVLESKSHAAEEIFNETLQKLLPCQPLPLLAWLKQYQENVYKQIKYIFSCNDYLRFRFTDVPNSEITNLSCSGMYDLKRRVISSNILATFGIPEVEKSIPPVIKSDEIVGTVNQLTCELSGLCPQTKVVAGAFDIDTCAVATGSFCSYSLPVSIAGTWSINEYISPKPNTNYEVSCLNSIFIDGEHYLIEACSPTSCGNLEWFIREFIAQSALVTDSRYRFVNDLFAKSKVDSQVIFHPYLYGTNAGSLDSASLTGLRFDTSLAEIIRAAYEGVCFSHKEHLNSLESARGNSFDSLNLSGGIVYSDSWCQLFSDILGKTIKVVEAKELGALGAAILGATALGIYPDLNTATRHMVKAHKFFKPNLSNKKIYDQKYAKYQQIKNNLQSN